MTNSEGCAPDGYSHRQQVKLPSAKYACDLEAALSVIQRWRNSSWIFCTVRIGRDMQTLGSVGCLLGLNVELLFVSA